MISSMTGYGKSVVKKGDINVEAEIKSVNSRFLDLSVKLPKNLMHKEFEIRELIKGKIKRGKVTLSVYVQREGIDESISKIDEEALKSTAKLLEKIQKVAKINEKVSLENILNFQNLFLTEAETDTEEEYEVVAEAVIKAVDDMQEMRAKEGKELEKDLSGRLGVIEENVASIQKNDKEAVQQYFAKLKERAQKLVDDLDQYDERLKMELALLAERYDVTEECVRLKSHIKMFRDSLKSADEIGRTLNFISQEMNREANTINSKSVSTNTSHLGIKIKEELEKIREQIQNIE